jgi:hypothetical protein
MAAEERTVIPRAAIERRDARRSILSASRHDAGAYAMPGCGRCGRTDGIREESRTESLIRYWCRHCDHEWTTSRWR